MSEPCLQGRPRILIGRSSRCHVIVESPLVSRRHCALIPTRGGYLLQDLGSRNGTWVEGERRQSAVLHAGDHFRIADIALRLGENGKAVVTNDSSAQSSRLGEFDSRLAVEVPEIDTDAPGARSA
ncbi:MAG: FHA domain-containing protein [Planctomycetota bacterium]